jgi:hypothetical protein
MAVWTAQQCVGAILHIKMKNDFFPFNFRRLIWESNLRYIQQHNLEAVRGLHTYVLGENEYDNLLLNLV